MDRVGVLLLALLAAMAAITTSHTPPHDTEIDSEQMDEFNYHKVHVRHLLTPWEVFYPDLYPYQEEEQKTLHCFSSPSHKTLENRVSYNCFVPDLPLLVRLNIPITVTQRVIDAVIAPHYWTMAKQVLNNTYTGAIEYLYIQDLINYNGVDVRVITQGRQQPLPPAVFENDTNNDNSTTTQINKSEDTSLIFELPKLEASDYKVLHLEDLLDPQEFAGVEHNTTQKIAWCFNQLPRHPLAIKLSTFSCTFPDESYQILLDIPENVASGHMVIAVVLYATFSNMVERALHGKFIGISRHDYTSKCEESGGYGIRVEDSSARIIYLPVAVPSEVMDYTGIVNIPTVHNKYQIVLDGKVSESDTEEWYSGRCYKDVRSYTDDSSVYQPYICMQDTEMVHYKLNVPKALKPHNIIDMALSKTVCDIAHAALTQGSYKGVDLLFFLKDLVKANFISLLDDKSQAFTLTVSLPPPQFSAPDSDQYYAIIYLRESADPSVDTKESPDVKLFRCLKDLLEQTYVCHHHTLPVEIQLDIPTDTLLDHKTDLVVTSHYWEIIQDALNRTLKGISTETYMEDLAKTSSIGVKVNTLQGLIALPHAQIEVKFEEASRFDREAVDNPTKVYFSDLESPPDDVSSSSSSSENKPEEEFHCFYTVTSALKLPRWSSYTCYHHETPIRVNVDIPSWFLSEKTIDVAFAADCWEIVNNAWYGVEHGISEHDYVHQLVHNNAMGLTVQRPGSSQKPVFLPPVQPEKLYVLTKMEH